MSAFRARTRIGLANPQATIAAICSHMQEHDAELRQEDSAQVLLFRNAKARFSNAGAAAVIDVCADTLEDIYFVRMAIAAHVLEFAADKKPIIEWAGDGCDLVRPPNFQILHVVATQTITPHMRRLTLSGPDVARFVPMDALHLNILVQRSPDDEPQWPTIGADGLIQWPHPERHPHFRKYTVRSIDAAAGTLDVDFVVHPDAGPGSALALSAEPGDQIGVVGPGGGGLKDADWYLFAGDETALPAIARMLAVLPETAAGKVFIEIADDAEMQPLATRANMDIEWLSRNGRAAGTTNLLIEAVRQTEFPSPPARVYAWAGCEFDAFRAIRSYLRQDLQLTKNEQLVVSYWRKGAPEG